MPFEGTVRCGIDFNVALSGLVFGYYNGDFNLDGLINIDDYGIIDVNVGTQGPPLQLARLSLDWGEHDRGE